MLVSVVEAASRVVSELSSFRRDSIGLNPSAHRLELRATRVAEGPQRIGVFRVRERVHFLERQVPREVLVRDLPEQPFRRGEDGWRRRKPNAVGEGVQRQEGLGRIERVRECVHEELRADTDELSVKHLALTYLQADELAPRLGPVRKPGGRYGSRTADERSQYTSHRSSSYAVHQLLLRAVARRLGRAHFEVARD